MQPLTSRIRAVLRSLGVDVRRYPSRMPGVHLGRDLQAIIHDPRPVVFDVGAREGESVAFFRALFPQCTIHSFEPSPATFRKLASNTADLERIHTNQVALGSKPSIVPLLENADSSMTSILELGPDAWGSVERSVPVEVDTVDAYCTRAGVGRIDVLKIDAQGYDLEILKGAAETLDSGQIKVVLVEVNFADMYKSGATLDQIYRFALDHAFRLMAFYNTTMLAGMVGWADAMFVHRSASTRR